MYLLLERGVRRLDERVDVLMHVHVHLRRLRPRMPFKEGVHRAHDGRVAGEGADDVRDARGLCGVGTRHRLLVAAADADREAAAQRLSVRDDVGLDAVCGLGALRVDAEAGIHLVEDQEHISGGADRTELLEPLLVARLRAHLAVVVLEDEVRRRRGIEVEALERVDEDGRNLGRARFDDRERERVHVLEA